MCEVYHVRNPSSAVVPLGDARTDEVLASDWRFLRSDASGE
jgi:hypothetical protein